MRKKTKLQKHFAYRYKDRDCYKHMITIPESLIKQLGWKDGIELEQKAEGNILIVKPLQESSKDMSKRSNKTLFETAEK